MLMTTGSSANETLRNNFQNALAGERNMLLRTFCQSEGVIDFARSVSRGMNSRPRRLECRFLYDKTGSTIYERICEQPEYYPTRTESEILAEYGEAISRHTGPVTILELGSGSSDKMNHLLPAYTGSFGEVTYCPIDISECALEQAIENIARQHHSVRITGVNGTYETAYQIFGSASPALVLFLGGSIGNFDEDEFHTFWTSVSGSVSDGDYFLLGADLVKDRDTLEAAYDDAAGVTASFTRNLFSRMNREFGAGLDLDAVEHLARYNSGAEQIEIYARFNRAQELAIQPLNEMHTIRAGEEILVEISRKFQFPRLQSTLRQYGFKTVEAFMDKNKLFSLLLLQKVQNA